MVEVLVRQDNMGDRASGKPPDVGVDRGRFGERGTGVDEQRSGTAPHQSDRDIAER